MATLRQAINAIRQRFPEHVALLGMSREDDIGKLGEDGQPDERGQSWWFEFAYYEDDGTQVCFGNGYVHGNGVVEGLYEVECWPEDYPLLSGTYAIHCDSPDAVPGAAWVAWMGGA